MMNSVVVCAALLLLSGCMEKKSQDASPPHGQPASASPAAAPRAIAWVHDFNAGLQQAKAEGKSLMVDFYADWCGWCHKLDQTTYRDPELVAMLADFVCVKVNTDRDRSTPGRYGVQGLPTIVFLNKDGVVKETVVGYRDAAFFRRLISEKLR